ncbi:MAG TPA: WHG domain-containing protein [Deltaproteobacteria bacterium]|nr:WHG domain-containing protein [Deltaproteobacteria bacterium]HQI82647.1 WHG domain-containing protein [Deltaproteobacteria bacterium]
MPEKRFSSEDIVNAAFQVIRKEGWDKCTARSIARELGSSTMPIYSALKSMKNIEDSIAKKASDVLLYYQTRKWSGLGFLDMGVGYVMFAQEERNLFRMMYFREPGTEDDDQRARKFRGYVFDALMERLEHEEIMEGLSTEQRREVLSKMWVFSHGLAVLINNAVIEPMNESEISQVLMDTGSLIITGERSRPAGEPSCPFFGKIKGHVTSPLQTGKERRSRE